MPLSPGLILYLSCLAGLLGAAVASFVCCAVERRAAGRSPWQGRSSCDSCGHVLGPADLVPIFSYLLRRGRCHYCGAPIPRFCLLSEVLLAVVYISLLLRFGLSRETLCCLYLAPLLLALSLTDIRTGLIPDRLLLAGVAGFVLISVFFPAPGSLLLRALLSGLAVAGPLLVMVLIADWLLKKETMGGGDIKLFFVTGLYLTWQLSILHLFLSCLIGLIFALIARRQAGQPFPFAPAICLSWFLCLLAGDKLLSWYLGLF